jgi:hypothetical protein
VRHPQPDIEDPSYTLANALYYQSRRNRLRGCNKDTLRRLLALSVDAFDMSVSVLLARGWVMENKNDVILTAEGWQAVMELRRRKTHAAIRFLTAAEQLTGVGSHAYRFGYVLRDNIGRQFTHSVTVSITDELCRRWRLLDLEQSVDESGLIRLLRRLAFDHVAMRVATHTLNEHENFHVGGLVGVSECRYHPNDLPQTEQDEYEVEWQQDSRH